MKRMLFSNSIHGTVALFVCIVVCTAGATGRPSNPPLEQLVSKWKSLEQGEAAEQKSYVVDFALSVGVMQKDGPKTIQRLRTYHVRSKAGYKYVRVEESGFPPSVFARSPRYAFGISAGKSGGEQTEWAIAKYFEQPEGEEALQLESKFAGGHGAGVLHPLSAISSESVAAQWFGQTGVTIQTGVPTGNGLVSIDFSRPTWNGTILIDPQRGDSVTKCESRIQGPSLDVYRAVFTREFASESETQGRLPQCKQITHVNWDTKDNKERINLRLQFRDYTYDEIPEDIFSLSYYGLPEPAGMEPPPRMTPRYVWLLVAAGIFVILAVGFRFIARWTARVAA